MSIQDKLQIYLITYNRKKYLTRTLEAILDDDSPIKNFDITILDNASTDGSSELIQEYCIKYPNIKHIKHKINIGGNANICRAFEMGGSCGKEYFWILCDDDKYDFSNWSEVEKNIQEKKDIICVSDYVFNTPEQKENPLHQMFQLTFVPAGIYKTQLITNNIITNMYQSTFTMFQQDCVVIDTINNNKKIQVLSKPVVLNGIYCEDPCREVEYIRGQNKNEQIIKRMQNNSWILGYCNILSLLKNKDLQKQALEVAIPSKEIYGNWDKFYNAIASMYINPQNFSYFYEIYEMLPPQRQQEFIDRYYMFIKNSLLNANIPINQIFKMPHISTIKNILKIFIQKIFSIKNDGAKYKVITILGFKIKFLRKQVSGENL